MATRIQRYELGDPGPDTLEDVVPSEKFKREFPSGKVPIKHGFDLGDNAYEALLYRLGVIEALHLVYDVERLTELREKWLDLGQGNGARNNYAWNERRRMVRDFLDQRLTLRALARFLDKPVPELVELVTKTKLSTARVLELDELLVAEGYPAAWAAGECYEDRRLVGFLASTRGIVTDDGICNLCRDRPSMQSHRVCSPCQRANRRSGRQGRGGQ